MKIENKNIFYTKSELKSKIPSQNEAPQSVFRQELVTWSHTKSGINKTTVVRQFCKKKHIDSFISEPIIFNKDLL